MSVHYIVQKTLNIKKCTKGFLVNYNTLLHVSTLLGHPQGETSVVVTLGCTIQLSEHVLLTVHCAAYGGVNSLWSRLVLHISGVRLECALAGGAIRRGVGGGECSCVAKLRPGVVQQLKQGVVFMRILFWYEPVFLVVFLDL
jgi:hypothetical protein